MTLTLVGLGARARLEVFGRDAAGHEARLRHAWSRCVRAEAAAAALPDAGAVRVGLTDESASDHHPDDLTGNDERLLAMLATQAVTQRLIAARRGELLMLHAGAVCDPVSGAALAFVAPGGTGKTTLARALGAQLGYLTDETVGITPDWTILPYPKPLSLREGNLGEPKREVCPDDLGLVATPTSARLAALVFLERDPAATGVSLQPLGTVEAITRVTGQSSSLSALPRGLHLLADLFERVGPLQLCRYGEAAEAAPLLADHLAGGS